jgi:hypothetical protein
MSEITTSTTALIAELATVRNAKAELTKREGAIRKIVLEAVGNIATAIADDHGVIIAEIVSSERRSITDWDNFQIAYPEAYKELVKFTDVLTLTLK